MPPVAREEAILTSLGELDRWKRRQQELQGELEKVNRQVSYYEALIRDMKKEVRPAGLRDFLRTLFSV